MHKMIIVLLLSAFLSGCLDMDLEMTILDDGTVETTMVQKMARQLYELTPDVQKQFCTEEGAIKTVDEETVFCTLFASTTLAAISEANRGEADDMGMAQAIRIERLGDRRVKLIFPLDLSEFKEKMESLPSPEPRGPSPVDAPSPEQMQEVMRVAFAGHSIVLMIIAQEVLTTNGQIENAGKTAKLVIPVTDLLSGSPELPDRFVAELRY